MGILGSLKKVMEDMPINPIISMASKIGPEQNAGETAGAFSIESLPPSMKKVSWPNDYGSNGSDN